MKKLIKIQYRGEMSTFDLFYRSIMYDSSKSILSSKGILSPKAFLRIIRSLWRALWSTYLTWICFLNLGLIIAKKLLATLSLVKFILWLFLPDHFHKFCIPALTSWCLSRLLQKEIPSHGPLLHLFLLCPAVWQRVHSFCRPVLPFSWFLNARVFSVSKSRTLCICAAKSSLSCLSSVSRFCRYELVWLHTCGAFFSSAVSFSIFAGADSAGVGHAVDVVEQHQVWRLRRLWRHWTFTGTCVVEGKSSLGGKVCAFCPGFSCRFSCSSSVSMILFSANNSLCGEGKNTSRSEI